MKQFLIILRGAPASGKTTIAKKLRDFNKKIVWLKVDNFKDFFSENPSFEEQKYVDECALASLKYLLDNNFSVIIEKIFYDPFIIPKAVAVAREKGISVKVFQISTSLKTLQERDRNRPGVKEGCRKPLGDQVIKNLFNHLKETYYPGAIDLDTEKLSIDECVDLITKAVNANS